MRSYVVTFTSRDGDTYEVDQPARSLVDAVAGVHRQYGHLAQTSAPGLYPRPVSYYQGMTPFGIETYRVVAYSGTRPNRYHAPVLI